VPFLNIVLLMDIAFVPFAASALAPGVPRRTRGSASDACLFGLDGDGLPDLVAAGAGDDAAGRPLMASARNDTDDAAPQWQKAPWRGTATNAVCLLFTALKRAARDGRYGVEMAAFTGCLTAPIWGATTRWRNRSSPC
jgi:hypothetical protein